MPNWINENSVKPMKVSASNTVTLNACVVTGTNDGEVAMPSGAGVGYSEGFVIQLGPLNGAAGDTVQVARAPSDVIAIASGAIARRKPLAIAGTSGKLKEAGAGDAVVATANHAASSDGDQFSVRVVDPGLTSSTHIDGTSLARISTIPIGGVAYGSLGTDKAAENGVTFWTEIFVPEDRTFTGIGVLNGGTSAGVDKAIVCIASPTGTILGNSALAGVAMTGTNAFQEVPFTVGLALTGPARYWLGVQWNGTTNTFRTIAANTYLNLAVDVDGGAFGTLVNLTPPTTTEADVGPIAYLY